MHESMEEYCKANLFTVPLSDTAYCKNYEKNAWYYFDDSSVSESDEESTVVSHMGLVARKPVRSFRPGPTQTGLYCHRRWLEA